MQLRYTPSIFHLIQRTEFEIEIYLEIYSIPSRWNTIHASCSSYQVNTHQDHLHTGIFDKTHEFETIRIWAHISTCILLRELLVYVLCWFSGLMYNK